LYSQKTPRLHFILKENDGGGKERTHSLIYFSCFSCESFKNEKKEKSHRGHLIFLSFSKLKLAPNLLKKKSYFFGAKIADRKKIHFFVIQR
jgi:hypothetical protein